MAIRFLVAAAAASVAAAKYLSLEEMISFYGRKVQTEPVVLRTPRDANQTLRQAAVGTGVYIGSEIALEQLTNSSDKLYNITASSQFNLLTAQNECKWSETEPQNGVYTLGACQAIAAFGKQYGMAHRLHNLDWGVDNPYWLTNPPNPWQPAQLNSTMTDHATKMVQAFGPNSAMPAYCTDTVNEAVSDSGGPDVVFKPADPWYPALPDYVATQFYAARAADTTGQLKLFYNDYGAEGLGTKSDKVYNMVAGFVKAGVPIDGVGLQMHISVDAYPSASDLHTNMARLVALGLEVHVTEMDVRCDLPCGADRLAIQAQIYGNVLQACLDNSKPTNPNGKGGCTSFEVWGFTDRYTWIWDFNNPTHANLQPLPWDFNYNPKPAFYELLAVLQNATATA